MIPRFLNSQCLTSPNARRAFTPTSLRSSTTATSRRGTHTPAHRVHLSKPAHQVHPSTLVDPQLRSLSTRRRRNSPRGWCTLRPPIQLTSPVQHRYRPSHLASEYLQQQATYTYSNE